MTEHDPSAWLASIAEIFDRLGVDWTVVGALAANRYRATPLFTPDLDTMARHHAGLVDALQQAGYEVLVFANEGEAPHLIRCHRGPEAIDILLPVIEYQAVALAAAGELLFGATATEGAHRSGFADSAHLTRNFRRMLGTTPSELVQRGPGIETTTIPHDPEI